MTKEILDLEKRIQKELDKPVDIIASKVQTSMPVHPYIATHVSVEMEDLVEADYAVQIS